MKVLVFLFGALTALVASAQQKGDDKKVVTEIVKAFTSYGDQNDVNGLQTVLHDNHRLVWNDGTKDPFVADKSFYLGKIESKEWGGDKRDVKIESVKLYSGINATVTAILDGEKAEMKSIFSLVKIQDDWKIIEELVSASFK